MKLFGSPLCRLVTAIEESKGLFNQNSRAEPSWSTGVAATTRLPVEYLNGMNLDIQFITGDSPITSTDRIIPDKNIDGNVTISPIVKAC